MNPIMKKEMRMTARSLRFPIALMIYGALMTQIVMTTLSAIVQTNNYDWYTYSVYDGYSDYSSLVAVFFVLVAVQMVIISIIIPVLTASSIAGERERQTLDILLTAPISSKKIVLGKLFAAMANVLMYIVCSLPAMAVTFMYGGVSYSYLAVFMIGVAAVSFLWGAVGIFNSAVFKKTVAAVVMSLIWEVVLSFLPLIIVFSYYVLQYQRYILEDDPSTMVKLGIMPLLLLFSPACGIIDAMYRAASGSSIMDIFNFLSYSGQSKIVTAVIPYWDILSLVMTILLGVLFILAAASKVNNASRKEKKISKKRRQREI